MAAQRPAWQVALGTAVSLVALTGAVWKTIDVLMVSEAEAAAPITGFVTKAAAEKAIAAEAKARADADASLAKVLEKLVTTVERIDDNQILIGERLRVRKLDRGEP